MKTANQYIEEFKSAMDNNDPVKAIDIFKEVADISSQTGNNLATEVHRKCSAQIIEALQSDSIKEKMERQAQERKKAQREEEDRIEVWSLSRWPELKDRGILSNGDLIQLSVGECLDSYREGNTSFNAMMKIVNATWDGLFCQIDPVSGSLKNIKRTHNGLIFFEGKAMYIDCGDRAPIPVFPDSRRRFNYCSISVLSKAS